ncbi:hypothetical protein SAY86_003642 [Trapa natans]|uniref:BTB domain-containing protein n=1 Tax=Trapa natans TaxID=22666 RepID=A0AAN7RI43_TRANT|nr:hypothetical protein SAY86_003642 [Trapa natans]
MEKEMKFLTVAPFECAWHMDLKFHEAGRGCVAFEAFAHNDVTVVFRENVGSQHYHYKMDNCPHYTVILGSHRNRRFKIEVDGKTVVDEAGLGLCCSSTFQSYWISIYDGVISVGKGRYPFQNLFFQWMDSNPNCNVRYVGLSSWDKHVGYRNVSVLPLTQNHIALWKQLDSGDHRGIFEGEDDMENGDECIDYEKWGLENFLESWELSDIYFIVGNEERPFPAHKIILGSCGKFSFSSSNQDIIYLPDVSYHILRAFLQYIYTGHTKVTELQLDSLRMLSQQFEVLPLVKQCGEILEQFKLNKKPFDSGKNVELSYSRHRHQCMAFPSGFPLNLQKLRGFQLSGEYSDVNIYVEGLGQAVQSHKVILSLWSVPFAKMLTNGMSESISSEVSIRDVSGEAFKTMLDFMYCGDFNFENNMDPGTLLLELLLLADQFGVTLLQQECCRMLLECLSEDTVCPILRAISSLPTCKLVEETCERYISMHFDYCTTFSSDFSLLDKANFSHIIQHADMTVTSEERVLNAILTWCLRAKTLAGWEEVDEMLRLSPPGVLFEGRLLFLDELLPWVRFGLLPLAVLKKMEKSNLSRQFPVLSKLVEEALNFAELGYVDIGNSSRFQHRRSSFKELQYICDGDSNGVLYFAGTSYGEHQWVNPVVAKRIVITASSPISRFTDPKALASRTYQGTSFAGPRIENGHNSTWWMVDLGQDHQLMCNYYTLRQDGSKAYIRYWKLQGSMDGKSWADLRVHENDQTMCKPRQFTSWSVTGSNALLPFRYFRVLLTGHTTDTSNPWNFCICFLELYGYFH